MEKKKRDTSRMRQKAVSPPGYEPPCKTAEDFERVNAEIKKKYEAQKAIKNNEK